ncbi:hypothetical protein L198_00841 [Cryptococcus wingfieldii CBS 7118]|uniref:J domain-containing protein n=1 Tax=Cryptococcus wingfieldii CBS 7118 TaxID=1295528 RepID=A0A1E3K4U0_9TREE|nr:hypothetical protein L198_00841 [Cryptococcus wingfieldii CBS 7118]ODO07262.1 hypothetical protein L198_00841 [Cryptococcus wingfieldii CBS 7118]
MSFLISSLLASFLPSQITTILLPHLSSNLPTIFPPAPKGSPTYARNYRVAFTGVICVWQAYTLAKGGLGGEGWYGLLGVTKSADEDELKKAFRLIARQHHPDRAGPGSDDFFIAARKAYETLSDPVKRYAYDRFGPQIVDWKAASVRENIYTGLQGSLGFYIVSGIIMFALAIIGKARAGSYWVHTLFASLLAIELSLILSPALYSPSALVTFFIPRQLLAMPQYLQIALLHRLFTALSITISQLAGVWSGDSSLSRAREEQEWQLVNDMLVRMNEQAQEEFHADIIPLMSTGNPHQMSELIQDSMENVLYDRILQSHPQIRDTYREARIRAYQSLPGPARTRQPANRPSPAPAKVPPPQPIRISLEDQLKVAVDVPLPPSPPPTPKMKLRRKLKK